MGFSNDFLLEKQYTELCEKLSVHKLPRWEAFPDIELYMDQVVAVMEKALSLYIPCDSEENKIITPSIINNYVKLKVIPAPEKKRYSREHLAYLVMICILKQTLSISSIVKIIELQLSDKSIDKLYNEFCGIYEDVISFVSMSETDSAIDDAPSFEESDDMSDNMSAFVLKSAIISTAGKFITEGLLSVMKVEENRSKKDD